MSPCPGKLGRIALTCIIFAAAAGITTLAFLFSPATAHSEDKTRDFGRTFFAEHCAACHGTSGKGDGPAAKAYPVGLPDFTSKSYMEGLTDEYLKQIISTGGAPQGRTPFMPGFGFSLSEEELNALIVYIRTLARSGS